MYEQLHLNIVKCKLELFKSSFFNLFHFPIQFIIITRIVFCILLFFITLFCFKVISYFNLWPNQFVSPYF